ncbi:MAG TPA: hypothetical protein VED16_03400 [Candidatus Acidoferrum sp.]|nr:hypothetical protein [Candidatus Acidoferrum sp.]
MHRNSKCDVQGTPRMILRDVNATGVKGTVPHGKVEKAKLMR